MRTIGKEEVAKRLLVLLLPIGLLGALVRVIYLLRMGLPEYDPWRHLQLVENIRSGRGFTLFDGQPYIWLQPAWYYLCAALPHHIGSQWLAGLLSLLSVGAGYFWLRASSSDSSWAPAIAAIMMSGFGPLVAFTCQYGPEGFALFLMLAALAWVAVCRGSSAALGAGVLFGIALAARMNLAFNIFLFFPLFRKRSRLLLWFAGMATPLAWTWWRNHQVIASYPYVFTWDGLATRSADFNLLSTLVVQMHPAVSEGLRRLHVLIAPVPQWFRTSEGISWESLTFLICAAACLIAGRRLHLILAGFSAFVFFLFFDRSLTSNFFRIYLGVFPALIAGVAIVADRLRLRGRADSRGGGVAAGALVVLVFLSGLGFLRPQRMNRLEEVTPSPELLTEDAYMVNSAFYHPESLVYRYPSKRFIGLPLDPGQLDEFLAAFPGYRTVLWHDFSVQEEVLKTLVESRGYRVTGHAANSYGRRYLVLKPGADF